VPQDFAMPGGLLLGVVLVDLVVDLEEVVEVDSLHPLLGFGESIPLPDCWMWLAGVPQGSHPGVPSLLACGGAPGRVGRG